MKLTLLASVLALGFAFSAHAADSKVATFTKLASHSLSTIHVSEKGVKSMKDSLMCNLPGETCYAENSEACCSGLCINQQCD
jgi:hypothetical protein